MFEELKERYSDDIELIGVLDEYESFIKSPLKDAIQTAKKVLVKVMESLDAVDIIDLDSESRDVERIKMLMDMLIAKSIEIDDIATKRNIVIEEKVGSYADRAAEKKRNELNRS